MLFLVQPMFSKMVLPLLGGTPAVWNTCMLFFQAALLGGYLYAHVGSRWLGVRRHTAVHLVLLLVAMAVLPIEVPANWIPPTDGSPALWLLTLLAFSLGLPFFAMSASGPLIQKWFSETRHADAGNPYFLYAASNVGSMLALLGYPFLIEPRLTLAGQSLTWSVGFAALFLLFAVCAAVVWRMGDGPAEKSVKAETSSELIGTPTLRQRLVWMMMAFIPSSLLLGVTGFLTTDVASIPLLWILPLAIYLLTFVLVFARRQLIPQDQAANALPYFAIAIVLMLAWNISTPVGIVYPLHLAGFFVLALVCHGELALRRPSTAHLTEFYLWMSAGGVLGGIFNVLIAPNVFNSLFEYPLAVAAACVILPLVATPTPFRRATGWAIAVALGLLIAVPLAITGIELDDPTGVWVAIVPLAIALPTLSVARRSRWFATGVTAIVVFTAVRGHWTSDFLFVDRTFFAVHRVLADDGGGFHHFAHGTTRHGTQSLNPETRYDPLSYYSRSGPFGQIVSTVRERIGTGNFGVVGLGIGTMACFGQLGDQWTFYEIDPVVEKIARDPRLFTYLRGCPVEPLVILGDARMTLDNAPRASYDLLVLDAFSSDAIPMHLLTREALELYRSRLADDGVIAFNISNRHLDLRPVLAALAADARLKVKSSAHEATESELTQMIVSSHWLVMSPSDESLSGLLGEAGWIVPAASNRGVWTDDFSNLLSVLK